MIVQIFYTEQLQYYKPGRDNQDLLDFAAA